jgi:hypothetical protein
MIYLVFSYSYCVVFIILLDQTYQNLQSRICQKRKSEMLRPMVKLAQKDPKNIKVFLERIPIGPYFNQRINQKPK